jgi:hypothetical protein
MVNNSANTRNKTELSLLTLTLFPRQHLDFHQIHVYSYIPYYYNIKLYRVCRLQIIQHSVQQNILQRDI